MRPVAEFFQRFRQRINARIAILMVVLGIGGVAAWQGYTHMAANGPAKTAEKKKVFTGVAPGETPDAGATASRAATQDAGAAAVASLYNEQTSQKSSRRTYQPASYTEPNDTATATQPPTNPYDVRPYGNYGGQSAAAADDSSQPPTSIPANPYRRSLADDTVSEQSPTESAEQSLAPVTDASAYDPAASAAGGPGGYNTSADELNPSSAPPPTYGGSNAYDRPATNPPTNLSAAGLNDSPYASATRAAESTAAAEPSAIEAPAPGTLRSVPGTARDFSTNRSSTSGFGSHSSGLAASAGVTAGAALPTPGERQLEGPQQPAISIEKFSPSEIQVGKPATFELLVRNVGPIAAQNVVVSDQVPAGTQLVDVRPQPAQGSGGSLVWQLGTMQPGEEKQIAIQVMPQAEGEIGSTAQVTFAAQATSRSICTRPQLTVEHTAPPKVLIGESLTIGITVANPGSGPATGVTIEEDVPAGLTHVAGSQLEYEIGTLRPGESKRLELSVKADKPGLIENTIVAKGEGNLLASHKVQIEVIAPQLEVDVNGPKKRFLERQATYTVSIANPGTAPARDVELVAYLPRGMKFIESDSQGTYDVAQHAVFWSLEELPPAKAGSVKLTTLPVEPGEQRLRIEGRADLGLAVAGEQTVQVEQSAELLHTVKDADEVIEVGSETSYEIRVTNTGTKAATNVSVTAILPAGMQGLSGEGPTRAAGDATQIVFEPLAKLAPQEEVIYRVQVQGVAPGDHLVRVQLSSDEWPTPVTREESTRVYEDR